MSYVKIKDKYKSINCNYDGVELCYECGIETDFTFNPVKSRAIKCEHCGTRQMPCSLCDARNCGGNCLNNIRKTLLEYAEKENLQ